MSEKQYSDYKDIPIKSLGLMSNEIWHRDPKMFGIHLARYKFVAKMLAGKDFVAEVGCGDGFYSKVVAQEVRNLTLFDFDEIMSPKEAIKLDILRDDLRQYGEYDAIYSLDVMEHISPEDDDRYLRNICWALKDVGTFIVGMPSLESQFYASPASKVGHINCYNSDILKKRLEMFFHNVFMFGMNDETLHTGFGPMCHYILGVCCGVR